MRGWEEVTEDDINEIISKNTKVLTGKIRNKPVHATKIMNNQIKSKYGAKKTEENGIVFDSKKEAKRYQQLKLLERGGLIHDLELQVEFELQPSFEIAGEKRLPIKYIADFVYSDNSGNMIVEDVKGMKTDVYKLKKKLFEYKYSTKIKEV